MPRSTGPAATVDISDNVAVITLNRPQAMNAVNRELSTLVGDAIAEANANNDVRVIVLTGAGRGFCAGADIKEMAAGNGAAAIVHDTYGFGGIVNHYSSKPIIAAVHGFALGGGFEIAAACDLIVATEDTKFGLPEVQRGLIAAGGGLARAPRQIQPRRILELVLTGQPISAQTALDWGFVNRVVPEAELMDAAMELARTIARNAPLAVQASKKLVYKAITAASDVNPEWTGIDPWAASNSAWDAIVSSADAKEGTQAFVEKRAPNWTGC